MDFHYWMIKQGIPYYRAAINTQISTENQLNIPLPKQLPTDIGRVFGLSTYCDGFSTDNSPLITSANAQNLYLNLKDGATDFFTPVRLDDLQFNFAGVPDKGERYLPVNIPRFDLSTSFFINPTGIVSAASPAKAKVITLNVWYININTYNRLVAKGEVLQNGLSQEELKGGGKK